VDSLERRFPFLQRLAESVPYFSAILAQAAPVALVALLVALSVALRALSGLEGHVARPAAQASLFDKLALFKIVHIFLVSAVSGSVLDVLAALADSPGRRLLAILGGQIPGQAPYMMQLMLVRSCLGLGLELLRVGPCAAAWLRGAAGPGLTAKERGAAWMGLRPLSDPGPLDQPVALSDAVLMLAVVLAYAALAPATCAVLALGFGFAAVVLRNQCAYVYAPPAAAGGGGLLWPRAIRAALLSLALAQVVVAAAVGLREGYAQLPLLAPLPVATLLYLRHLGRQHFRVAERLPLAACARADMANAARAAGGGFDYGVYAHPALRGSGSGASPGCSGATRADELSALTGAGRAGVWGGQL
jgi:hypothetical protein